MNESLEANYKRAYDNQVGFGARPALILIDFVQAYFDPACELYAGVEDTLASALRVRALARDKGLPVILTNVIYHPSGLNGGRFFEKAKPLRHLVEGSALADWPEGLAPQADEFVISKQYPSAFFGTSLAPMLTSMGRDSLIITGITTSGCVRATCVDSMSHGFITTVVADACGDRHPAPHEANLFDMNAKYADVVSEDDVMAYLGKLQAAAR